MLQAKRFQKRTENFVCDKCGAFIKGQGYTDHCPKCLWSKHLDINPGDRLADCGGLMKPRGVEAQNKEFIIYYQCTKCGYKHRVKSVPQDNFDEILNLSVEKIVW